MMQLVVSLGAMYDVYTFGAIGAAEESINEMKAKIGYDSSVLDGVAFDSKDELLKNMRRKRL